MKTFKVNHEPFITINKPIYAYILGLLWADGHVAIYKTKAGSTRSVIQFTTTFPDNEHFEKAFKSTGEWNIQYSQRFHWKRRCDIITANPILTNFLLNNDYGAKSFCSADKILSKIPLNLHRFWYLGLIDGDGCFFCKKETGTYCFSVSSSYNQDWNFMCLLADKLNIPYSIVRAKSTHGDSSKFIIFGGDNVKVLGNYLYGENQMGLPRKHEKLKTIEHTFRSKSSIYPGISLNKKTKRWRVLGSQENGAHKTFGSFKTENEALQFILSNPQHFSKKQLEKLYRLTKHPCKPVT